MCWATATPWRIPLVDTNRSITPDHPNALPETENETESIPRNQKASYEANADVQRWLHEQEADRAGTKPPFNPTFLAHQRDRPWVLSSLTSFYEDDLITDVLAVVKSGKEATVYCCAAHPSTGLEYVAAKVYRPRMFRSLRNDAVYRASRPQVDAQGREGRGAKRWNATAKETERGRAAKINAWIRYEYETQRLLFDAGTDAPRPLAQSGNAVLMEYIGGGPGTPAPLLREVSLGREEATPLFERVLRNIELWLACDRVHGDLSAYNMLYWHGAITIIDFAQAVDPRYNPAVGDLLARDITRVCQYFARFGVEANAPALAGDLWLRYLRAEL
jgi:RIO kinase 1